jgi:tetratricopeptide (TPR) repeat protein
LKSSTLKSLIVFIFLIPAFFALSAPVCLSAETENQVRSNEASRVFEYKIDPKVAEHFAFRDDFPEFGPQLQTTPVLKPWNKWEKTHIQMILEGILDRAPGLVMLACAGEKISFYRIAVYKSHSYENGTALAVAGPNGIYVTDASFLSHTSIIETIAHELTHLADRSDRLAYSREFLGFALPKIKALKEQKEKPSEWHSYATDPPAWPMRHTANKMVEVFAEYVSIQYCFQNLPHDQAVDSLLYNKLFYPSKEDIEFAQTYRIGLRALIAHDLPTALHSLKECVDRDPNCLNAAVELLRAKMLLHTDLKGCLNLCKELERNFAATNLTADDNLYHFFLVGDADVSARSQHYSRAIQLFDKVLASTPHDQLALVGRARTLEKQRKYALALQDIRQAVGYFRLPAISQAIQQTVDAAESEFCAENFEASLKLCEKALATDDKAIDALVLKCRCCQKLKRRRDEITAYERAKSLIISNLDVSGGSSASSNSETRNTPQASPEQTEK